MSPYWHWDNRHSNFCCVVLGPFSGEQLEFADAMLAGVFLLLPRSAPKQMLNGAPHQVRALVYARAAQGVAALVDDWHDSSSFSRRTWDMLVCYMLEELGYIVLHNI